MNEPRNRVVQIRRFGGPDGLDVVDAPLPTAGPGEVRVRVLASGLEYTDVLIRRRLYPQTSAQRPPFVMGYDVVAEIDQLGDGVTGFQVGEPAPDVAAPGLRCQSKGEAQCEHPFDPTFQDCRKSQEVDERDEGQRVGLRHLSLLGRNVSGPAHFMQLAYDSLGHPARRSIASPGAALAGLLKPS